MCNVIFLSSLVLGGSVEDLFRKGYQFESRGDYKKAIAFYEKIIEIDSNFAPVYNHLGLAYQALNKPKTEVAWYFKVATDINPNYTEAYANLGKIYYQMGHYDKAEKYCLKALSIDSNFVVAQLTLGWIYLNGKSRPNDAIYYFNKTLEKIQSPSVYFGLGMAYLMNGDNPLVLEIITILKGSGNHDLAQQLENLLRRQHSASSQGGKQGSDVSQGRSGGGIGPGFEKKNAQQQSFIPKGPVRVRLRGKLHRKDESSQ